MIAENVKFHCCEFKFEYYMVKCNRCKNGTNVHFNEFECSLRGSLWNKLFKLLIVIIDVSNELLRWKIIVTDKPADRLNKMWIFIYCCYSRSTVLTNN